MVSDTMVSAQQTWQGTSCQGLPCSLPSYQWAESWFDPSAFYTGIKICFQGLWPRRTPSVWHLLGTSDSICPKMNVPCCPYNFTAKSVFPLSHIETLFRHLLESGRLTSHWPKTVARSTPQRVGRILHPPHESTWRHRAVRKRGRDWIFTE